MKTRLASAASSLLLASAFSSQAFAQGFAAGYIAPPDAMDNLSGGSLGPSPGPYMDRARGAAAGTMGDPFAAPPPGGAVDPFGNPVAGGAGDPFGAPAGGATDPFGAPMPAGGMDPFGAPMDPFGAPSAGGFGTADPWATGAGGQVAQPKINVIWGTRIIDAVTGEILEDARSLKVLATAQGDYFDDGVQGMDAKANDNVYTNVTVKSDVMSAEANLVKTRLIRALELAEEIDPLAFSGGLVASPDIVSNVPNTVVLEEQRDQRLKNWAQQFLRDFRVDPDNPDAGSFAFIPTHLPHPPRAPEVNIPSNFVPPSPANAAGGVNGGLAGFDATAGVQGAFGTNNIANNPAASSGYFGSGGAAAAGLTK